MGKLQISDPGDGLPEDALSARFCIGYKTRDNID
jgi:hypothetical protein